MARTCSIGEAKNTLPKLVREVETGGSVTLLRRGRPVAVLVSVVDFDEEATRRADFWRWHQDWQSASELTDGDVDEWCAAMSSTAPEREPTTWGT